MIPESDIPEIKAQARKDNRKELGIRLAVKEILGEFTPETLQDLDRVLEVYLERCTVGEEHVSTDFLRYANAIVLLKSELKDKGNLLAVEI